jgi:hypothetical protein
MIRNLGLVLFPARVAAASLGIMGLLAAMLAITGTFGVAAYSVSKRMRELGIRVALGAHRIRSSAWWRPGSRLVTPSPSIRRGYCETSEQERSVITIGYSGGRSSKPCSLRLTAKRHLSGKPTILRSDENGVCSQRDPSHPCFRRRDLALAVRRYLRCVGPHVVDDQESGEDLAAR